MSYFAFGLILLSAVMHALWNVLVKRSHHKTVFTWWMFVCAALLTTAILPFVPESLPSPDVKVLLLAVVASAAFVLYHLLNGRAYHSGDLSLAYPLAQTSMLYVPILGVLFLGEQLSVTGIAGILLVAAGAYIVQLERISPAELLRPFRSLNRPGVRDALAAGFVYSFGAVADKLGVIYAPVFAFTYQMVLIMTAMMTVNLMRPKYRPYIVAEWRRNRGLILISGPVLTASFLAFRYGLKLTPMSYAVPARQVSVLAGVLIGSIFLREPYGPVRVIAALTILAGAFLIKLG